MSDLDQSVQQYYAEKSMSAERVDLILAASQRRRFGASYVRLFAAVAVLVLLCFGAYHKVEQMQFKQRVLAEIAMNHSKNLAVEVASTRYGEIEKKLGRLDFSLAPSPGKLAGLVLVGGRYCSIQGQLAAQLKVFDPAGEQMLTLYITPLDGQLEQLTPLEADYGEVSMRCWRDGTRFFALAVDKEMGR